MARVNLLSFILRFTFLLGVILLSSLLIIVCIPLHLAIMDSLGVFERFGENAKDTHINTISYILGWAALDDSGFFNAKERNHLQDVRSMVVWMEIIFGMLCVIGYLLIRTLGQQACKPLRKGAMIALGLLGVLMVSFLINFEAVFLFFHSIFFKEGTFLFDPMAENIVNLYPQEFFLVLGVCIGMLSIIFCILLLYHMRKKQSSIKQKPI